MNLLSVCGDTVTGAVEELQKQFEDRAYRLSYLMEVKI